MPAAPSDIRQVASLRTTVRLSTIADGETTASLRTTADVETTASLGAKVGVSARETVRAATNRHPEVIRRA
jgi:hypothetical protein